ncbi:MAG TPA: hypothetical protein VLB44_08385 [Kofleriaceae bacterium]|nr:hypothetical protein [Kofleriaceae bacterium]
MRRWRQVALATVLLAVFAPWARADPLADARKAVEGSDYLTAQPALEKALKAGTAGPADLAEIYKLTGIVEGALGNADISQTAFGKWLALDPKGSLPPGTSPKITRPFTAAQKEAQKKGPLQAKAETQDNPPAVTLVVENDPMKMIVGARVYFTVDKGKEQTLEAEGKDSIKLELEKGKRLDLRLHGLDEYGNHVVELGSKDVPIVITSSGETKPDIVIDKKDRDLLKTKPPPPPPATPRSWYLQWWLWGSVAVVATATTGYFGYKTKQDIDEIDRLNANSLDYQWHDAQVVESRARSHLLVTNIAAGTAGVFALGAAILFLTRPDTGENVDATKVTVTPTRGGGAIVLGGHF